MTNTHELNRMIITVIGSTKFRKEIAEWALKQTIGQKLVLFAPFAKEEINNLETIRDELEIQHFQKIRMADLVFVFNKNGYIGQSTQMELDYSINLQKKIEFLEPPK